MLVNASSKEYNAVVWKLLFSLHERISDMLKKDVLLC